MNALRATLGRALVSAAAVQPRAFSLVSAAAVQHRTSTLLVPRIRWRALVDRNRPSPQLFFANDSDENLSLRLIASALAVAASAALAGGNFRESAQCMPPKKRRLDKPTPKKNSILKKAGQKGGRSGKGVTELDLNDPADEALHLVSFFFVHITCSQHLFLLPSLLITNEFVHYYFRCSSPTKARRGASMQNKERS